MTHFRQIYAVDGSGAARGAARKRPIYRLSPGSGAIRYCPAPSGLLSFLREQVLASAGAEGPALLAVDVPLGLPRSFPEVYGAHASFPAWLLAQGGRPRESFVAADVTRQGAVAPFVASAGKGDKTRGRFPLRRCDVIARAESRYWCVGGRQVGKAALQLWVDVLL